MKTNFLIFLLIIFVVAGVLALIESTPLGVDKELQQQVIFNIVFWMCTCISLTLAVYVLTATHEPKKYRVIAFFFMLFFIFVTVMVRMAQDKKPLPEVSIEQIIKT